MTRGKHIVSGLVWDTAINDKGHARQLMQRISNWSRYSMERQLQKLFDDLCPADQTWKIQALDVDLGEIAYNDLEYELNKRLLKLLAEKLKETFGVPYNQQNETFKVMENKLSELETLKYFLLNGLMPWNHNGEKMSANQLLTLQLQTNFFRLIHMVRSTGATHETFRKRLAWQMSEESIRAVIKGLEPGNHQQIFRFSDELHDFQRKKSVVKAGVREFKKNVWHWILNYLLAEKSGAFNRKEMIKSSLRQMANHYNISYRQLLDLIDEALAFAEKNTVAANDFIKTLHSVREDEWKKAEIAGGQENEETITKSSLELLLKKLNTGISHEETKELNNLITGGLRQNEPGFESRLADLLSSEKHLLTLLPKLNTNSVKILLRVLAGSRNNQLITKLKAFQKFLNAANIRVEKRMLWELAIRFLSENKEMSFDTQKFIQYLVPRLGVSSNSALLQSTHQLNQTSNQTLFESRETQLLFMLLNAPEAHGLNDKIMEQAQWQWLLDELGKSRVNAKQFQERENIRCEFIHQVKMRPQEVFNVLVQKNKSHNFRQWLNHLLDEDLAAELIKGAAESTQKAVSGFKKELKLCLDELSVVMPVPALQKFNEMLYTEALNLLMAHPGIASKVLQRRLMIRLAGVMNHDEWSELIQRFENSSLNTTGDINFKATNYFLTTRIFSNRMSGWTQGSKSQQPLSRQLLFLFRQRNQTIRLEVILRFMRDSKNKLALSKLLLFNYADKHFKTRLYSNNSGSLKVMNFLVGNASQLLNEQIKKHLQLIKNGIIAAQEKELRAMFQDIFWKCLLSYNQHAGNYQNLKHIFQKAIQLALIAKYNYHSVAATAVMPEIKGALLRLKNGGRVGAKQFWKSVEQALQESLTELKLSGQKIQVKDLLHHALHNHPEKLMRTLSHLPAAQLKLNQLKNAVDLEELLAVFTEEQNVVIKEELELLLFLNRMAESFASGQLLSELQTLYWQQLLHGLKNGKSSLSVLRNLVRSTFTKMALESEFKSELLITEMRERSWHLTPQLRTLLASEMPVFSSATAGERVAELPENLRKWQQTGMLDYLTAHALRSQPMPLWLNVPVHVPGRQLLSGVLLHFPHSFMRTLRNTQPGEADLRHWHRLFNSKEVFAALAKTNRSMQHSLERLFKFYGALTSVSIKGISSGELQYLLFRKIILAAHTSNWRLISEDQLWQEMRQEVCTVRGVSVVEFDEAMENLQVALPLALQVSWQNRVEAQTQNKKTKPLHNARESKTEKKTNIMAKQNISREPIAVRNAGMVLLSIYFQTLFERLKLITSEKKFISTHAQQNSVHYLQFLVTGHTETEEFCLPLNKVLCGIPLHEPVSQGIAVSETEKHLMWGLLNAAISYWPSAGEMSVDGFRGNWLVRGGLLREMDDKWELTVEKRIYDILINQSPFTFSIIKYPWMQKPLHVNWPY